MNRFQQLAALSAAATIATTMIAAPAGAQAAGRPSCPIPANAKSRTDEPAKGYKALKGVRLHYLPKGFTQGEVVVGKDNGITEYGYVWSDGRDDVDMKHRSLWVRVMCWPEARKLAQLKKMPVTLGTFAATKTAKIGGRKVLTKVGDGALGHGRYAGWVEREGVVVTVMASEPLVPHLDRIIRSIRL
ncbi:hypothetical protein ETD86_14225 [Nonomuraea turkmeniaca]|uniref:DUF4367 domain-containing protein n=1 Tax=Nonomuraea turkmeniaca TaxID=103838 RepID=A0A5S4FM68_9ACTN|nr:hypothetical protein [Nonomuraea turkmeniaca]TMR21699.1 hypothetical protein ETD86_14225 [Nonomuraea turkmeniaca]